MISLVAFSHKGGFLSVLVLNVQSSIVDAEVPGVSTWGHGERLIHHMWNRALEYAVANQ